MILKNYSKWIVTAGTLTIWSIKFIIRPFVHVPDMLKPFTDVAPNLIGTFLLPFVACWFLQKYFRLETLRQLKITCWVGLVLVIINEYLQLIPFFGRTFDYLDILFSFVGTGIGYYTFAKLMARSSSQEQVG